MQNNPRNQENFNDYGLPTGKNDWFIVLCIIFLIFLIYKINLMHNNI